jgi:uncharacterized protein
MSLQGLLFRMLFIVPCLYLAAGCSEPTVQEKAERGDALAQYQLAVAHNNREEMPEAVRWYRKSAEQGFAPAQVNLGFLHVHGKGVARDPVEAVNWFRKAAEEGNPTGQVNLGSMYADGLGVEQDNVTAYMWYSLAAGQGEEKGVRHRDELAGKLTREELDEAETRIREWKTSRAKTP